MQNQNKYQVGLVGSTTFTAQVAQVIAADNRYKLIWTLSPETKVVGRKKDQVDNLLHVWSTERNIPSLRVSNKIDQMVKNEIVRLNSDIDILLVVDFGYFVPQWLLSLPRVAPLNLHPSKLPEWRGSSPGQAVLLSGTPTSAITLMQINNQLDQGPIIFQQPFSVHPDWTQTEYYQTAFASILPKVGNLIEQFILGKLSPITQPDASPTPIARELTKADGFIPWEMLIDLMSNPSKSNISATFQSQLPPFLAKMWQYLSHSSLGAHDPIEFVARAVRALSPWSQVWTIAPTNKGDRRLKILSVDQASTNKLVLKKVQLESQQPALWNQIKNNIIL